MKITTIHSYLVNPEKGQDAVSQIKGTPISHSGNMFNMLEEIFKNAEEECRYDISFMPTKDGVQQNDCRDLVLKYIEKSTLANGKHLAERLQSVTTKRSGLGLLFLIAGEDKKKKKLVISRFPADNGILAEEVHNSLNVHFVERIFMKSAKAYKSAFYEGTSLTGDFWTGKAIDKQINSDLTISDYWIKDFLISDFSTTSERGTKRLATAFRDAINKSNSLEIKEELTSALKLAKGLNNKIISAQSFSQRLGLSNESTQAIKSEMKSSLFNEQFKLSIDELNSLIAFKTVELDNGALLTAIAGEFDDVFLTSQKENGKVSYSTTGRIIDERVKKRK